MIKRKILAFIVIVVLIAGAYFVLSKYVIKRNPNLFYKPPTLSQLNKLSPISKTGENIKKKAISNPLKENQGDLLLLENQDFKIEYAKSPDAFFVTMKSENILRYEQYNDQVENWFVSKGFNKDDLCKLVVIYAIDPNLKTDKFIRKLPSCR
ncbi:MAG: hypothetical protein Q8P89_03325 [bacterium]|nr:hypothetical protein [bacterium]